MARERFLAQIGRMAGDERREQLSEHAGLEQRPAARKDHADALDHEVVLVRVVLMICIVFAGKDIHSLVLPALVLGFAHRSMPRCFSGRPMKKTCLPGRWTT